MIFFLEMDCDYQLDHSPTYRVISLFHNIQLSWNDTFLMQLIQNLKNYFFFFFFINSIVMLLTFKSTFFLSLMKSDTFVDNFLRYFFFFFFNLFRIASQGQLYTVSFLLCSCDGMVFRSRLCHSFNETAWCWLKWESLVNDDLQTKSMCS